MQKTGIHGTNHSLTLDHSVGMLKYRKKRAYRHRDLNTNASNTKYMTEKLYIYMNFIIIAVYCTYIRKKKHNQKGTQVVVFRTISSHKRNNFMYFGSQLGLPNSSHAFSYLGDKELNS
jgi:hypothetical protein